MQEQGIFFLSIFISSTKLSCPVADTSLALGTVDGAETCFFFFGRGGEDKRGIFCGSCLVNIFLHATWGTFTLPSWELLFAFCQIREQSSLDSVFGLSCLQAKEEGGKEGPNE